MSDIREVTVRYGRTANLGNYESERVDVELTATVGADQEPLSLTNHLLHEAKDGVDLHLREFERQRRDEVTQAIRRSNVAQVDVP
jgi:hypothetical protein